MLSLRTLLSTLIMASTIASASATTEQKQKSAKPSVAKTATATIAITNNADQWLAIMRTREGNELSKGTLIMAQIPPHSTVRITSQASAPLDAFLYTDKAYNADANVTFYRSKESIRWHTGTSINLVFPDDFVARQKEDVKNTQLDADSDCTCDESCTHCTGNCVSCACPQQDSKQ